MNPDRNEKGQGEAIINPPAQNYKGGFYNMTGWALFFVVVGVTYTTAQLFRFIDWIERPARRRKGGVRA